MMGRILSIWLPQLPLDRRVRMGDARTGGVFALVSEIRNAWVVTHLSAAGREAGLAPGMSVPDARAIAPGLMTEPGDGAREEVLLRALRRWADKFSPRVALGLPDGLHLDITGCAHLFGGEQEMAAEVLRCLADMQLTGRVGIADTKTAASALARFGAQVCAIAQPGEARTVLRDLPLGALGIPEQVIHELGRAGLKRTGQLYDIKSGELARRFGLEVTKQLACALGTRPDPITPALAAKVYAARMSLPEPVGFQSDILGVLERLSVSVCGRLAGASKGARRFRLTVRCVDSGDHELAIGFARANDRPEAVCQQFAHPLDKLRIEFGADWFRLVAEHIEPVRPRQSVIGEEAQAEEDIARVISALGNRLGFDRVSRFLPADSHLPEREFARVEAAHSAAAIWPVPERLRPLRLFQRAERLRTLIPGRPPRRFEWRKCVYETASTSGPERLTPEWWAPGDGRARDYWRVQTAGGARLWLVTYPASGAPDWYIAGRFP